jgi:hypothetical protein
MNVVIIYNLPAQEQVQRQAHHEPGVADVLERVDAALMAVFGDPVDPEDVAAVWAAVGRRADAMRNAGDPRPWTARACAAANSLLPS